MYVLYMLVMFCLVQWYTYCIILNRPVLNCSILNTDMDAVLIFAILNCALLHIFFNSVFQPTNNIPPRLLGETGVRRH